MHVEVTAHITKKHMVSFPVSVIDVAKGEVRLGFNGREYVLTPGEVLTLQLELGHEHTATRSS